jgi:hypothetical protein
MGLEKEEEAPLKDGAHWEQKEVSKIWTGQQGRLWRLGHSLA